MLVEQQKLLEEVCFTLCLKTLNANVVTIILVFLEIPRTLLFFYKVVFLHLKPSLYRTFERKH